MASFLPDTSNAPVVHSQATKKINYSTKRAHKMRGANKKSVRSTNTLKKIHLVEQFLGLPHYKQKSEMETIFGSHVEFITEHLTHKKKPSFRCELWVGGSLHTQRKGRTSGKAFRAVMETIAPTIAQHKLAEIK